MFGRTMYVNTPEIGLKLRPFADKEEYKPAAEAFSDQSILRYFDWQPYGFDSNRAMENYDGMATGKSSVGWAIEDASRSEVLGYTLLWGIKHVDRTAMSATLIWEKDMWGKGIASAVNLARTFYAARVLNLVSLGAYVLEPNQPSQKALTRLGYIRWGVSPRACFVEGKYVDSLHYVWFNPAFVDQVFGGSVPENIRTGVVRGTDMMKKAENEVRFEAIG